MMKIFYKNTIILLLSFIATAQVAHAQEKPEVSTVACTANNHTRHIQQTNDFCPLSPASLSGKEFHFPHSEFLITTPEDCHMAGTDRHVCPQTHCRLHRTQQQAQTVSQQTIARIYPGHPAKMYPNKTI